MTTATSRRLVAVTGTVRRSPKLAVGLTIVALLVVTALLRRVLIHLIDPLNDPTEVAAYGRWLNSSRDHLLGTDQLGRDVLALVLKGLGVSLQIGAIAGVISTVVGVLVAFVGGYKGGMIDAFLSSVTSILLVIPTLPLLIALSAYAREVTLFQVALMLSIFAWPGPARTIRAQVLTMRGRSYVELARMSKVRDMEIIVTELLPNMLPFVAVGLANAALGAIFGLLGLAVIGLGPSGVVDLGHLIYVAITTGALTLGHWPIFVAPIVLLSLLFAGLNYINIGLEEVYNPRLRGVKSD